VFQQTLDYQTSADITGDFEHVVSYGSLGYFRADSFRLDEEAQGALLSSARETSGIFPQPASGSQFRQRRPARC